MFKNKIVFILYIYRQFKSKLDFDNNTFILHLSSVMLSINTIKRLESLGEQKRKINFKWDSQKFEGAYKSFAVVC